MLNFKKTIKFGVSAPWQRASMTIPKFWSCLNQRANDQSKSLTRFILLKRLETSKKSKKTRWIVFKSKKKLSSGTRIRPRKKSRLIRTGSVKRRFKNSQRLGSTRSESSHRPCLVTFIFTASSWCPRRCTRATHTRRRANTWGGIRWYSSWSAKRSMWWCATASSTHTAMTLTSN